MARFVGGELQGGFMRRLRGIDPGRCLVVPVDVGKSMAMSLVADHYGEIVTEPFEFDLTETGVADLIEAIDRAERSREAIIVRVGVEAAGHYHRTAVARLRRAGLEVVELNPGAVKQARAQQLLRALKSDARDLGAMAELLTRGAGQTTGAAQRGPLGPGGLDRPSPSQGEGPQQRSRTRFSVSSISSSPGCRRASPRACSATRAGRVIVRDLVEPARDEAPRRRGASSFRRTQRRDR